MGVLIGYWDKYFPNVPRSHHKEIKQNTNKYRYFRGHIIDTKAYKGGPPSTRH